jgi:hypothetical protein
MPPSRSLDGGFFRPLHSPSIDQASVLLILANINFSRAFLQDLLVTQSHSGADYSCSLFKESNMNDPRKQLIEKRDAIIAKHGWAVVAVHPGETETGFSYSIGLEETLNHPELVFIGVPPELARQLINDLAKRIRSRDIKLPLKGGEVSQVVQQFNVLVRPVPEEYAQQLARGAFDRHYPDPVRLLQICIPDTNGVLPDKPWCDPTYIAAQDYKQFEV